MSELEFYNKLAAGQKLSHITVHDYPEGWSGYELGEYDHQAKDITVIHENGQMAPVAWARVELNSGATHLVNLANVESVVLQETPND